MDRKWRALPRSFDLIFSMKWEWELLLEISNYRAIENLMRREGISIEKGKVVYARYKPGRCC